MSARTAADRSGFTLVEVLISMTVLSIILVTGLSFLSSQTRLFAASVERSTALTRGRYVTNTVQRDLRSLGTNLSSGQPALVYSGADVIAFNADYSSNLPGDPFAVYVDPDVPAGQVAVPEASMTIPQTAFTYGDTVYRSSGGSRGPAELLILYLTPDTTTTVADDFVLYRQVNDAAPEPISDGIRRLGAAPFFQYWIAAPEESAGGLFQAIPDGDLPLAHAEPFHLAPADTGASARVDSVRAVAIRFAVWPNEDTTVVRPLSVNRMIALPNAGVSPVSSCGSAPLLGTTFSLDAVAATDGSGSPLIELSWPAALDEGGGETDVIRYAVWRRTLPDTDWGDPRFSLPAGAAPYVYSDATVQSGTTYEYAVAAQDCTPTMSSMTTSGVVIVP
jgi:prepilin-type N-terminal cleavage/methylation domain-containing protein